jgi:hypothetical protein
MLRELGGLQSLQDDLSGVGKPVARLARSMGLGIPNNN